MFWVGKRLLSGHCRRSCHFLCGRRLILMSEKDFMGTRDNEQDTTKW